MVLLRLARTVPGREQDARVAHELLVDVAPRPAGSAPPSARGQAGRSSPAAAVSGSQPLWGDYCSFCALNWATKFFLDGLLIAVHDRDEPSFQLARR